MPLGVRAHVVQPRPGPHTPRYEALGAAIHQAASLAALRRGMGPGALLYPLRLARASAAVASIARATGADLVHTNMEVLLEGGAASRILGLPHVLHYRGNTLDEPRLVFDGLVRLWTATADRIFCISEAAASVFRRRGRGDKVEVHYNPVDLSAFRQSRRDDTVRQALGAGPGDLLLGTVGRIHPRKDVATFLRAVAVLVPAHPHVRAVVIGGAETPEERTYQAAMVRLADEIGIAGHLCWAGTRRDMPAVLQALDVFVLSSRHEGFGRVVAEAMAAATPMVLSNEGALPELAGQGSLARLARPADPADFALEIEGLVRDPSGREALAAAGRRGADRFDARVLAAAVYETYSELVASRRRPRRSPSPARVSGTDR